jgi:hypothetical protein
MILSGRSGIAVVPFDAAQEPVLLESDDFYPGIDWAMSDHRGGIVFRHTLTPRPWAPGSVMWLRAGASAPEVLVGGRKYETAVPIGMATSRNGHSLFVFHIHGGKTTWVDGVETGVAWSWVMAADLDDGGSIREVASLEGSLGPDHLVAAGGDVVVVLEGGVDGCISVTVRSVDDGAAIPTGIDCIPGDIFSSRWIAVSDDGRSLAVSGYGADDFDWSDGPPPTVMVFDLATGEILEEGTIDVGDVSGGALEFIMQPPIDLISAPGGWLARVISDDGIRIVGLDGVERARRDWTQLATVMEAGLPWHGARVYHHGLVLAPIVGLGSGSGEVPCRPSTADLPHQDLPEPVAATRQLLFDLAGSCEYRGLAALASENETLVFTDGCCWLASEVDLVSFWVSAGLSPPQAAGLRSREPLASLVAVLGTRPAYVDDIPHWPVYVGPPQEYPDPNPEPGGCVWVWPALYVQAEADPGDSERWAPHYDYRVGIAADGTWRFFMAHSYERGVSPNPPLCGDG